jgi:hypothetical protein
MRLQAAAVPRGHARAYSRNTMTTVEVGNRNMSIRTIAGGAVGLALILGLSACTNPYDPAQRTIGGGLLGAATGAAIGAAAGGGHGAALGAAIGGGVGALTGAATTPPPPPPPGYPPQAYYPPPPDYGGAYGAPPSGGYGAPPPGAYVPAPPY